MTNYSLVKKNLLGSVESESRTYVFGIDSAHDCPMVAIPQNVLEKLVGNLHKSSLDSIKRHLKNELYNTKTFEEYLKVLQAEVAFHTTLKDFEEHQHLQSLDEKNLGELAEDTDRLKRESIQRQCEETSTIGPID